MEENKKKENMFAKPWVQSVSILVVVFGLLGGFLFWQSSAGTVFIENSVLEAPIVNLSPVTAGTLNALYVHTGDSITANTVLSPRKKLVLSQVTLKHSVDILHQA